MTVGLNALYIIKMNVCFFLSSGELQFCPTANRRVAGRLLTNTAAKRKTQKHLWTHEFICRFSPLSRRVMMKQTVQWAVGSHFNTTQC